VHFIIQEHERGSSIEKLIYCRPCYYHVGAMRHPD